MITWKMILPILIIVASNTVYNISTKSTPESINPFASLGMTYCVAMLASLAAFFISSDNRNIITELNKANWTTYALGLSIVGLEFGFISSFRAGWKISTASLVASILLGCVLLAVGLIFYRENLSVRQIIGIAVCAVGLILIAK